MSTLNPRFQDGLCKDVLSQVNRISPRCVTLFTSPKEFSCNFFFMTFFFFLRAGESLRSNARCLSTLTHPLPLLLPPPPAPQPWATREDPTRPRMQPMHPPVLVLAAVVVMVVVSLPQEARPSARAAPVPKHRKSTEKLPRALSTPKTPKKTKQSKKTTKIVLASLEQLPRRKVKRKKKEANGSGPTPGPLFSFPNTMHVK